MERVAHFRLGRSARSGQALVEYSLVLAVISVVAIGILGGLGENIRHVFLTIMAALATAGNGF